MLENTSLNVVIMLDFLEFWNFRPYHLVIFETLQYGYDSLEEFEVVDLYIDVIIIIIIIQILTRNGKKEGR